ncbi:ABC transporter substrate-binding protein [Leucobacter chinensis]|uniref:ABC transporter substrate-binding protein n=1 Tax=Leucobacter chinensis TaxID=2851010 RepID=UPI001C247A5E|nr:ABC transporter substrate-binding protein [Leucobacter chinensis]
MKRSHFWKKAGVAMLAASALVLTACSADPGGQDGNSSGGGDLGNGMVRIGTSTEVVNWTPISSVSITDIWVMSQMYPILLRATSDGQYVPHLADSVEPSEDGSQVTMKLNPDFAWSDGTPITVADVEFTLDRMRDDKLLSGVSFIGNYESTTIEDDHTAVIQLRQPSYGWGIDMAQSTSVLPKHVFEDVPNLQEFSIENEPERWVSGGAYTLDKVVAGQRYTFVPNEHYPLRAEGNDAVKGIEFQIYGDINTMQLALRNNDIDLMAPVVPSSALGELEKQKNIEITKADTALNFTKLTFNASEGPLSVPEVRAAISGLIDTDAIVTNVLQGQAETGVGPVIPAFTEYQPDITAHKSTADEVKKVLADAGYESPTLVLTCDQGNANHAKSAQLVRDMLAPADITVDIKCAERATSLASAKAGEFDLYIHKLNQLNSPSSNLFMQFDPSNPSGLNYNFTEDPVGADLLAKAQTATNEQDYIDAVKAAAKHIHEQAFMLPLYVEHLNSASNTSRFTGYVPTAVETSTMVDGYSLAQVTQNK